MNNASKPKNTEDILDKLDEAAAAQEEVTIEEVLKLLGRRSFGPLVLLAGLITVAPVVGDIPGVPSLIGAVILLVAVQLLMRREHIWFPDWLLKRSVNCHKLTKTVGWLRKPARFVDKLLKRRFTTLVQGPFFYVIAGLCIAIAGMTPLMEFVPFSANLAGLALTLMGLGLIADDGLLASIAMLIIIGAGVLLAWQLF